MEWTRPWMLWALVVLVPFVLWRWRQVHRGAISFAPLQYSTASRRRSSLVPIACALEALILATVLVALAGPHRVDEIETLSEEGLDIALVLDLSASMQAADFPPNRLEAVKTLATDFVERAGGNRIGIYAFAKHVFTQSPLTTDRTTLVRSISGLAYESIDHAQSGGTAIGDALLVATDALVRHRVEGRDQVLVLLSDGESHLGVEPELAARYLREMEVRLYVIGIGGDEAVEVYVHGEPFINSEDEILTTLLDDEQLREIAEVGGGRYERALDIDVLASLFDELSRLERTPLEVERLRLVDPLAPDVSLWTLLLFVGWLGLESFVLRRPLR